MYGLGTVGPIALGIARVSWKQFLVFNAIGALVWAVLFSSLGYVFGKAISTIIGEVSHYEMQAALAILAGGIVWFIWSHFRHARSL